jgi:hypothetical protein
MHSVAQVLSPEFGRTWHESVAIVQEVASQLSPGLSMPSPEDLLFDDSGALVFGFGSESNENPVTSLAVLLQGLIEGIDAPNGLRELAKENAQPSPTHATVESFARALAFYERPNRVTDVNAVAGRLKVVKAVNPDAEFERLREKVAGKKDDDEKPEKPKQTKKRGLTEKQKKALAVVSVGVAAFVAVLAVTRVTSRAGASSPAEAGTPGLLQRAQDKMAETLAAGINKITPAPAKSETSAVAGKSSGPAEAMPAPTSTSGRRPARDVVLRRPVKTVVAPAPPAASPVAPTPVAIFPSAPQPMPAPPDTPVPVSEPGEPVIYSSADRAVQPPVISRPQLPREPSPGSDTGYFDIVVNENGDVEQVKLVSPTRRYQERMLVAAAKAWKFRPAVFNGQSVKYRMRVPIILAGLP